MLNYVLTKLGSNFRVSCELVEGPREGGSSGISAGQENSNKLIAEDLPVASERCKSMQESVAFFGLGLRRQLLWGQAEGLLDIWIDELVDDFQASKERPPRDELVERSVASY